MKIKFWIPLLVMPLVFASCDSQKSAQAEADRMNAEFQKEAEVKKKAAAAAAEKERVAAEAAATAAQKADAAKRKAEQAAKKAAAAEAVEAKKPIVVPVPDAPATPPP